MTTTTNETKAQTIRTNHYAKGGRLVAGNVEVASMDEARCFAARWNRTEERPGLRVEIIRASNGLCTAVY